MRHRDLILPFFEQEARATPVELTLKGTTFPTFCEFRGHMHEMLQQYGLTQNIRSFGSGQDYEELRAGLDRFVYEASFITEQGAAHFVAKINADSTARYSAHTPDGPAGLGRFRLRKCLS